METFRLVFLDSAAPVALLVPGANTAPYSNRL